MANAPSPFSSRVPQLQLALDSTSLGEFKTCPRKYQYRILEGWVPRAQRIDLVFGLLIHGGVERYHHAKARGESHANALDAAVDWTLRETWDSAKQRPLEMDDPQKNRISVFRTLVWYLDQWGEAGDPLQTIILQDGKPAVELSFQFGLGIYTQDGEEFIDCGHMDRMVQLQGDLYDTDVKTTRYQLDKKFFSQFSPDNQMYNYMTAGQIIAHKPIKGIIIDGLQIGAGFVRNQRHMLQINQKQIEEWLEELREWLEDLERCARRGYWRKNDKACNLYRGCEFRGICSRSPEARQEWLEADFQHEMWNPLEKRGDI